MLTKREKILILPWQKKRYEEHRQKVKSAKAVVDVRTPTFHPHVLKKLKKIQTEKERKDAIERENVRLLQSLGLIMKSKRIEDIWMKPRPDFLNRQLLDLPKSRPQTAVKSLLIQETDETSYKPTKHSIQRCMTCTGGYVKRNQVIPEERIPWEPNRKSWNVKLTQHNQPVHKCCKYCC